MNEEIGMGNAMENAPRKREGIRLNKYLSEAGVCSRREADEAVEAGEVLIDGHVAVLGDRILEGQIVTFKGQDVSHNEPEVLIAFNKPRGVVCTAEKKEPDNIVDYINYPVRIYPVGRLDKESRGLILLTNQGNLVNKLNRGGNFHEKEYIVRVDHEVNDAFLRRMMGGVYLNELHVKTRPCKAWKSDENEFHIILTQGLNRQIRRMCEALGYRVRDLKRVRIMDILLRDLPEGSYRDLTEEEKTKEEPDPAKAEEKSGAVKAQEKTAHGEAERGLVLRRNEGEDIALWRPPGERWKELPKDIAAVGIRAEDFLLKEPEEGSAYLALPVRDRKIREERSTLDLAFLPGAQAKKPLHLRMQKSEMNKNELNSVEKVYISENKILWLRD